MSSDETPQVGTITWYDLTVEHADHVRDFYQRVGGWEPQDVDMGGYSDYAMIAPATGASVAGMILAEQHDEWRVAAATSAPHLSRSWRRP